MNGRMGLLIWTAMSVWLLAACFGLDVPVADDGRDGAVMDDQGAAGSRATDAGAAAAGSSDGAVFGPTVPGWVGDAGGYPATQDASVAGSGGAGAGASAATGPHCCYDANPCSLESCDDMRCASQYVEAGERGGDYDGDRFAAGCGVELDCWDSDANVRPDQTAFFDQPFAHGEWRDWDYNCDDQVQVQLSARFEQCSYVEGIDACVGEGWMIEPGDAVPSCGVGGAYAICRVADGGCVQDAIMLAQRCR